MARQMSEKAKAALSARRKKMKEERPSLRSVGLAGVLVAADMVQDYAEQIAIRRGVKWDAGSADLDDAIAEASARECVKAGVSICGVASPLGFPVFWHPDDGGGSIVSCPPTVDRRPAGRSLCTMTREEFQAWRSKQVEAAYLKYAPPGTSHELRKRFRHKLAFARVHVGDKQPTYEVNGVRCRLVVCYERSLLVEILNRAINPLDVHKYVASPCRTWPVWDAGAGNWVTRPRQAVRVEWSQLPTCQPGDCYPDVEKVIVSPVWKNQNGQMQVPIGCKREKV
jgi:hypothetical protein